MLSYIANILSKIPQKAWSILAGLIGISCISTPIAIAYLVVNSGSIEYKNADTQINLKGKKLTEDNTELVLKLSEKLELLEAANKELADSIKQKKLDKQLQPHIDKVDRAIVESEIVVEDLTKNQEELQDLVEEKIESP
ncbi:MAG: hypothetical protein QNJ53_24415 [Pleurocapsa sp. MO_192.B19]|nr:hypothetical protein [Pleurocapsa sp. MO_192.B19]